MKKRYIVLLCTAGMIALSFLLPPVRPFIQLPGEVYPVAGLKDIGWTNTFSSFIVVLLFVAFIGVFVIGRNVPTADEVPTGLYNFFEMIFEAIYNFLENIAGNEKARTFFPWFTTYFLVILAANWMGLIPGMDSIGFWEPKPHFYAEKTYKEMETELKGVVDDEVAFSEILLGYAEEYHAEVDTVAFYNEFKADGDYHVGHGEGDLGYDLFHEMEHVFDEENLGDLQRGFFLLRAEGVDHDNDSETELVPPDDADYTIVPFFRPAATDLNMTLALAIIAMVMVQVYGFKYLGFSYLYKFFPFLAGSAFGQQVAANPIKAIDIVVGLLELVSEVSKIISFAFRLLGNIFAGMVLLFVMAFLLPAANIVFFGLEFFVGLIQALVFGLLMFMFMVGASESHHGDDHGDHH